MLKPDDLDEDEEYEVFINLNEREYEIPKDNHEIFECLKSHDFAVLLADELDLSK